MEGNPHRAITAIAVLMDKAHADLDVEFYPAPQSTDDLKHFPKLLQKRRLQIQASKLYSGCRVL